MTEESEFRGSRSFSGGQGREGIAARCMKIVSFANDSLSVLGSKATTDLVAEQVRFDR